MRLLQGPFTPYSLLTKSVAFAALLVFCCLMAPKASAQDDLNVHGVVNDAMSSVKLSDVKITVKKDGSTHDTYSTRANGKYEFYLLCGHKYEFIYSKSGYVDRKITIDSKNIPQDVIGAGIIMPTDMSMYAITPAMETADLSIFEKPIGIAAYDPVQKDLVWDFNHTNKVKAEIFAFIRDIEKKQKEMDKESSAADKAREAEEAKFAKLVKDGDAALAKQDFAGAVNNYKAAIDIKDDATVKTKLADAETKLADKLAAEQLNKDYSTALDAADGFFRTEEFDKALAKYEEALKIKPAEKYPKDKIAEVNKIISDRAAQQAKQKEFDDLVKKGDDAVAKSEYKDAIDSFEAALKMVPTNKDVPKKIAEAQALLKKQEQEAANEAAYQTLISDADAKFAAAEYEPAKKKYEEAKKLKPSEAYPGAQIDKCNEKMAQLAKAAQDKAAFDGYMTKGQADLSKQAYEGAVGNFEAALALIPDDKTAIAKLAEAKGLLAEKQADAEKRKQYADLIAAADADFKNEKLNEALDKYTKAREVIPAETYPLDQINKINGLLAKKAESEANEKAYVDAMAAGSASVQDKRYPDAIASFETALKVKPGDKTAQEALEDAQKLKASFEAEQATRKAYEDMIAAADKKFAADELEGARKDYEAAVKIMPEQYPKDQIALIGQTLDQRAKDKAAAEAQAALKAKFDEAVKKGDSAFAKKDYPEAIDRYEEALQIIPGDPAVEKKLADSRKAREDQIAVAAVDEQYAQWIKRGDEKFKADALTDARNAYEEALKVKQGETYPASKIKEIDETLANREKASADAANKARLEAVAALLLEGDNFLKQKKYEEAISKYEAARDKAPERTDIPEKINIAQNAMLAAMESASVEEAYKDAIAKGDNAFKAENWETARGHYTKALEIKLGEAYPQQKLDEIQAKMDSQMRADEDRRRAETKGRFDKFIADGDARFAKKEYDDALQAYENALELIPDSELVLDKISKVNQALAALDVQKSAEEAYKALIREADALFQAASYEPARAKFVTASGQRPSDPYPAGKIKDIDRLLEQMVLADESARTADLNRKYNDALSRGDGHMKALAYEDAILAYEDALDIKPTEAYPQVQIDKANKLMQERDERDAARRKREAEAAEEAARRKAKANPDYQTVTNNSELQAEAFMREARQAEEREKYERIKKQKQDHADMLSDLDSKAEMDRLAMIESLKEYNEGKSNQFEEALKRYEQRVEGAEKYRKAMLESMAETAHAAKDRDMDAYTEILQQIEVMEYRNADWEAKQKARISIDRQDNELRLLEIESWSKESYERRLQMSERLREEAVKHYAGNAMADMLRNENARRITADAEGIREVEQKRANNNLETVRERSTEIRNYQEDLEASMNARNKAKVETGSAQVGNDKDRHYGSLEDRKLLADDKRMKALEDLRALQEKDPKSYTDAFRSELAMVYPQGVTEESSTLGNKVIITRIVVKGNKGDEFRKVLDKAGNYYFKNGQSISETTWNRETLDAFYKKD